MWCINNGMFLNASKTNVLLVTTPQKRGRLENNSFLLKYKDVNLQLTTGDKILGIHINENLKWDDHIVFIRKTILLFYGFYRESDRTYHLTID